MNKMVRDWANILLIVLLLTAIVLLVMSVVTQSEELLFVFVFVLGIALLTCVVMLFVGWFQRFRDRHQSDDDKWQIKSWNFWLDLFAAIFAVLSLVIFVLTIKFATNELAVALIGCFMAYIFCRFIDVFVDCLKFNNRES